MTNPKRFSRFILFLTLLLALCAGMVSPHAESVGAKPLGAVPGSVIISEVAWGGSNEWIELYNTTDNPININGWNLNDGANISLSGTIPAKGFYLVEDNEANVSPLADRINSITLTDTGETITLSDNTMPTAVVIDTANLGCTGCWYAGSGSPDYLTMQRVAVTPDGPTAWVSGAGTPRNSQIDLDLSTRMKSIVGSSFPITVTFTITLTNNGYGTATNIDVQDTLPVGLTYISSVSSTGLYDELTGLWEISSLNTGESETLDITATISGGLHTNTATISYSDQLDSDLVNNSDAIQLGLPVINVTNDASNTSPIVGESIVFTLMVENPISAGIDANNVIVDALLPSGLTYVSDDGSGSYNPSSGVWAVNTLTSGSVATIHITATIVSSGIKTYTIDVSSIEFGNSSATRTISTVGGDADLSLDHQKIVLTGVAGRVKLKVRLTNNGSDTATGIQVRDVLPSGLDYVSHEVTTGTYATNTGIWTVSSLANGNSAILTLTVDVASSGASTANFAEVWSSNQFDPDSTPANGSNSEDDNDTLEVPIADLSLTQTVDVASNSAIFTITLTNSGPDDAANVMVSTDLPTLSNYTYVSSGTTAGSYNSTAGIWTVGNLADGATASLIITTNFTGSLQTNWAEVSEVDQVVDPDSVPGNDSQKEDDDAAAPATDLRLEMSVNDATPAFNSRVEFTLKVTNDGPFNVSGVKVRDVLPSGLTYISTNPAGDYDPVSGLWTIGSIANGASATLKINARMTSYGTFVNRAEVWKSNLLDPDSTPSNGSTNEDDDASSTVSLTPIATRTPTASPARSVIINEIAWAGTASSFPDDEWIELYNPTSSAITLTGWKLKSSDGIPIITLSGKIPAGGYYLLERDNDNTVSDIPANLIYTGSLSNIGETLVLTDSIGRIIDTANGNGGTWPKGSSSTYGTMERVGTSFESDSTWSTNTGVKRNGKTASGGNILGTPKNANSATSFTPTPARTITRTPTPSRTPTFAPPVIDPRPIINEMLVRPGFDWNQDGETNVFDEFIEIKNLTSIDISLTGWRLSKLNSTTFNLPNVTLKPGQYVVFYSSETNLLLSDGGETIRLINSSGKIYDAFTYELARAEDKSFCRLPDGTPGNSWFEDCIPTPNLTNTREGKAPVSPDESASPFCNLPDTIPLDFFLPECNGYGADIWNPFYWDFTNWLDKLFIQQTDEKWHTFIE